MFALSKLRCFFLGAFVFVTACSHLDTKIDSHSLAIEDNYKINKILVVENAPQFGKCANETKLVYDDEDSTMAAFNNNLKKQLAKCGITVEYSNNRSHDDPSLQAEVQSHDSDAILVIQNANTSMSQMYVGGVAGNSAIMKASFDLNLYDKSDRKIWYANTNYDRTPALWAAYNTSTCLGTGIQFSNAILNQLSKDKILSCTTNQDSQ